MKQCGSTLLRLLQELRQCRSSLPQLASLFSGDLAGRCPALFLEASLTFALAVSFAARHLFVLVHTFPMWIKLPAAFDANFRPAHAPSEFTLVHGFTDSSPHP